MKKIRIKEVGPRDGLQNEKEFISTEDKVQFIEKLLASGLDYLEVSSFVHPNWIPQLADAAEVFSLLERRADITYAALVPNLRGLEKAIVSQVNEVSIFMSASEGHNRSNINKSISETFPVLNEVVQEAKINRLSVRGYVSTVIGCPYDGPTSPAQVLYVVDQLVEMGVDEISLGDTIGVGAPTDVELLLEVLLNKYHPELFAVHFHDTYGTALANIAKSLEYGITNIDSSVGGLGGCPYAKGASGNVATEDVHYMLNKMGFNTGVDLEKILDAAFFIEEKIGHSLSSKQLTIAREVDV